MTTAMSGTASPLNNRSRPFVFGVRHPRIGIEKPPDDSRGVGIEEGV